ncbi:hypothetical protein JXL83_08715 [candidate division WOR-3 bacterium]|nr:hypothetical protein [candidate division WOR-3 bacterium]
MSRFIGLETPPYCQSLREVVGRKCLFGDVTNGKMALNEYGKIVENEWIKTPEMRPNIESCEFVVMPNHFHGIIVITDDGRGTMYRAPIVGLSAVRGAE